MSTIRPTHLLDTNVCIALIKGANDRVRARMSVAISAGSTLATSTIVLHELWYGVAKSQAVERNARALSKFLSGPISVLAYSEADAQAAGEIRATLERQGQRIGEYDTLIAGQAFARNLALVTANTREFTRVQGVAVENWED